MSEKQRILAHLYMMRASVKTMLTNLQPQMNDALANELLDKLNAINEAIEKLEKQK